MTVENGSHPILKQSSALNWLKSDPAIIYPIFDRERKIEFFVWLIIAKALPFQNSNLIQTALVWKKYFQEKYVLIVLNFPHVCVCENHLVTCTEETFARKITAMTIHNVFLWLLLVKCNSLREKYCLKESVAEPGIWHFQPEA